MKLSTRSRYGTRLMLDMAEHYNEGPIQLGVIAKRQNIPVKYLEQIIIPLKKANYVKSVRGNRGGHMLAKPPDAISVGEIVDLMEGGPAAYGLHGAAGNLRTLRNVPRSLALEGSHRCDARPAERHDPGRCAAVGTARRDLRLRPAGCFGIFGTYRKG